MAILKPNKTMNLGGVIVNEFLLTKHNPRNIAMPSVKMEGIIGVTIHNTDWIKTAKGTTPAEQYTRATYNGNMNDVRVHYYVDHVCAWQNLPLDLSGWHAADGSGNGNRKTIAIECIMSSSYNANDQKSEDNAARLAAALLKQYGLGIECLFTHTHWLNIKNGKTGDVDTLNTMRNSYKMCPLYILPHWSAFKAKVAYYLNEGQIYRVRTSWDDEENSELSIESLEVFENIAYIMAKHADPDTIPASPDEWLEQFNTFSIYEILPQLIELWGLNIETQVESKKICLDREMTTPLFLLRCVQLGLSMADLDLLSIGLVNDMFTERENDDAEYGYRATQGDFDAF